VKFSSGGSAGARLARFLNKCIAESLVKLVIPGKGINVFATNEKGVTVALTGEIPQVQYFYLTDDHPTDFSYRNGRWVTASRSPTADDATPPAAPAGTVATCPIHMLYVTGWLAKGRVVRCEDSTGVWECMTPGVRYLKGTVASIAGSNVTVTLTGSTHLVGTTTSVVAKEPWFDVAVSDVVGLEWNDAEQCFDIGKIRCPGI
jgi:hypothetical protein